MAETDDAGVLGALAAARAARAAGDERAELTALLMAWRARRAPALADLIDHVSARIAARLPPIAAKTGKATLVQWLERARAGDPAEVGLLLAGLAEAWRTARAEVIAPRLDALARFADDPRVGVAALALLREPTMRSSNAWSKAWRRALHAVAAAGDPRTIEQLDALAEHLRGNALYGRSEFLARVAAVAAELRARFPGGAPAPSERERARADEVAATAPAPPRPLATLAPSTDAATGADLLAAVYADPASDEPRLVYADYLQTRGDPRGELIILQIQRARGEGTDKALARERALLRKHAGALLGPLASVVAIRDAVFERGFLAACVARVRTQVIAATELVHPEWATVRAIQFAGWVGITKQMSALEEVSGDIDANALARLCKSGHPRLTALGCNVGKPTNPIFDEVEPLARCETLPRLRRLRIASWYGGYGAGVRERRRDARAARPALPWFFRAPFGPALELLSTSSALHDTGVLEAWLAEIAEWPRSLRAFELSESESGRFEPPGSTVRFERDARGEFTLVTLCHRFDSPTPPFDVLDVLHDRLPRILEALPADRVVRLVVDFPFPSAITPDHVAGLRRIVDRRFTRLEEVRWPASFG
ncbi:MAG TPA: TIGR02996 domain-containing protein [Kofleriaceae bacterium]|nr:TIGR02996 domain-containing protein [Kofleriaceae bacterium]